MRYILAILTGAAIMMTIYNTIPVTTPLKQDDMILAFGDSLTYGFGAGARQGYPDVLAVLSGHEVINAGVNGETSADGLRRLPMLLDRHHPRLTILCFGGNDILQRKPMADLKTNLIRMIRMLRDQGSEVVLVSVPNVGLLGLHPLELYDEVADETDTPLISGVLSDVLGDPTLKSDQIHPNAAGYRMMAEKIFSELKGLGYL